MAEGNVRYAYSEVATPSMVAVAFAIMVTFELPLTMWDPWDLKDTLSGVQRLGFAATVGMSNVLICYSGALLALYVTRQRTKLQALMTLAATETAAAVPCTAVLYTTYAIFHDGRPPDGSILVLYAIVSVNALVGTALGVYVLMLRLSRRELLTARGSRALGGAGTDCQADHDENVTAARATPASADDVVAAADTLKPDEYDDGSEELPGEQAAQAEDDHTRLAKHALNRLHATAADDIVCLHVSGHYIDVTSNSGSKVILMRLADAVTALGDRGMQVHRSYWVAYSHMTEVVRHDHQTVLSLTNGQEVPVSRTFLSAVREALANVTRPGPELSESEEPPAPGPSHSPAKE